MDYSEIDRTGALSRFLGGLNMRRRLLKHCHKWLNTKNPSCFDEKLMTLYLKDYIANPLTTYCADKYLLRKYVAEKYPEYKDCFPKLLGVYKSPDEIDWEALPEKIVLKCNHDSGSVKILEKKDLNAERIGALKEFYRNKLKEKFGSRTGEAHYMGIHPRIIAEEYLSDPRSGGWAADYKLYCFNGEAACILLIANRERGSHNLNRIMVDRDFKPLNLLKGPMPQVDLAEYRPEDPEKLIAVAETVSGEFPFVRMDLYIVSGQILLGEMTFSPMGCINSYFSDKAQKWLGDWMDGRHYPCPNP